VIRAQAYVVLALVLSCKGADHPIAPVKSDPHSVAEPARVAVRHVSLDLTVDFDKRTLHGAANLELVRRDRGAPLRLDTAGLVIEGVADCASKQPRKFELEPSHRVRGRALVIEQPGDCVAIAYRTGPDARALLWVPPSGTAGKQAPMLFTQSQAIEARSWIPIQDTPGVRFTYDATIHVPPKMWAVMSAENPQAPPADGVWRFRMQQPIPAYLMALAVGDFAFRAIGPRTGVYAEPSVVDAAAKEFAEVDAMMAAAEKLYGPYRWGRYDMLVLPPSFPFGGMENPRLTFLTPTVITGDRTLVALIAHELAHSWSGNLVTNATWSDFWLNEGFTAYVERRIMEAVRGRDYAAMLWHLGDVDFIKSLGHTAPGDTRLALDGSSERSPDEVPSDAAYEKGALFLRTLEEGFGRPVFDAFMRRRFDRLAFRSTDTAAFEADVRTELIAKHPGVMTDATLASWLHDPGLPAGTRPMPSRRVAEIEKIATAFVSSGEAFDAKGWSTLEWVIFLRALPETTPLERVRSINTSWDLTASGNAEISMHWLPVAVRADAREVAPVVEAYLLRVGRRRMIRPLYEAMVKKGEPWKTQAKEIFERARPLYHPIVRDSMKDLVGG
jgi:leukotriene-A4 hydrolase